MLGRRLLGEDAAAAWGDFAGYAEVAELVIRVRHRCGLRPQQVARRARAVCAGWRHRARAQRLRQHSTRLRQVHGPLVAGFLLHVGHGAEQAERRRLAAQEVRNSHDACTLNVSFIVACRDSCRLLIVYSICGAWH